MATKTNDLSLTGLEIIDSALRKLGVLEAGGTSTSSQRVAGLQTLNTISKSFDGMSKLKYAQKSTAELINSVAGEASYDISASDAWVETVVYNVNGRDKQLKIVSIQDYSSIPDKDRKGVPSVAFITDDLAVPKVTSITPQKIYLWPTPIVSVTGGIKIYSRRKIQILSDVTDRIDLPDEWTEYLIWKLTSTLSFEYRLPLDEREIIEKRSMQTLASILPVQASPVDGAGSRVVGDIT